MRTTFGPQGREYRLGPIVFTSALELHDLLTLAGALAVVGAVFGLVASDAIGLSSLLEEKGVARRLMQGARVPCLSGLLSTAVSLAFGLLGGVLAGFWGDWREKAIVFGWETLDAFPKFILLLFLSALSPSYVWGVHQIYPLMGLWGLLNAPAVAEIARRRVLQLRRDGFIMGAYALGVRPSEIFFRHLLGQGCRDMVLIQATYLFSWGIVVEATLSYLGIHMADSWGRVFADNVQVNLRASTWPALLVLSVVVAMNGLGHVLNRLRIADCRLRRERSVERLRILNPKSEIRNPSHRTTRKDTEEFSRVFLCDSVADSSEIRNPKSEAVPEAHPILSVMDLRVYLSTPGGMLRAVDGVSFDVHEGEVVTLIGESGCGKTTIMYALMGLVQGEPGIVDGEIWFHRDGVRWNLLDGLRDVCGIHSGPQIEGAADAKRISGFPLSAYPLAEGIRCPDVIVTKDTRRWRQMHERNLWGVRGRGIAMMFQHPATALNPIRTVGDQLTSTIRHHQGLTEREAWERAEAYLADVEFDSPQRFMEARAHQLSDGECQRAFLALALASDPKLLIVDEPTKNLDLKIRRRIVRLLERVNRERGVALLVISHFIPVARSLADRVLVVYAGRVVEAGRTEVVLSPEGSHHPYTEGLLRSALTLDDLRQTLQTGRSIETLSGDVPSLIHLPSGCPFRPRCPEPLARADSTPCTRLPALEPLGEDHSARCWKWGELSTTTDHGTAKTPRTPRRA